MRFFLGTHKPHWLRLTDQPLFVSHRRLRELRTLPRAQGPWALDSGGFTELLLHGAWHTTPAAYVDAVDRYTRGIGRLAWAAPQDWMCEPAILDRTGLTVRDHQARTVANLIDLRTLAPHLPFIPVLQGWTLADYLACVTLYEQVGVDLTAEPLVGLGSVCRRQATTQITQLITTLTGLGLRLHGFGVKTGGLRHYAPLLASADSLAWSYHARRRPPLSGCVGHRNCANCHRYAETWRTRLLRELPQVA